MFALLVGVAVLGAALLIGERQSYERDLSRSYQLEIAVERLRQAFLADQVALVDRTLGDTTGSADRAPVAAPDEGSAWVLADRLAEGDSEATALLDRRQRELEIWGRRVAEPVTAGRAPAAGLQRRLAARIAATDRALIQSQRRRRDQLRSEVSSSTREIVLVVGAGLLCGLIAAILLFRGLSGSMRRPLERLVDASGSLAAGDLSTRVQVGGPPESVVLGDAFNEMASGLENAIAASEASRARLSTTLASLSDGVITVDRHGVVVDSNPAAARLLPRARNGDRIQNLLSPGLSAEGLDRLLAGGAGLEFNLEGEDRVLSVAASSLGGGRGDLAGAVFSIRDVSERARLERLKDDFVVTASHELRSPLTSVQGFAELLQMERDSLTQTQAERVEIIVDSTRHLTRLLNDLLDLARSDAGRLQLSPLACDPVELTESATRAARAQVEARAQQLTFAPEPGLEPVWADPDRVRQVLANLLTNSNEYCPEGASIWVSVKRASASAIEFVVADDGPGIPAADRAHIFDRFTRGDAGLTQRVGGTGLGLAVSKSLIELHGGSIAVEETPGGGATFRFQLPLAAGAGAGVRGYEQPARHG